MHRQFPGACILCGARASAFPLCTACHADLPWLTAPACPSCALPASEGNRCGHCLKMPPAFSSTRALFAYQFPMDALIHALKYRHRLHIASFLGRELAAEMTHETRPDLIIPMPLHPERLKTRGFNQALEIARQVSARTGVPLQISGIERIKDSPPQVGMSRKDRVKNLKGAFRTTLALEGKRIAIIDDVMTTGTSCHELSLALLKQGAQDIQVWVVARTLPD
ncbi:MAG: ComF family protein [Sulfuricellaceae bacterium]|nr:ComF family protein [Sulfuricellaceae bacterium]